MITCSLKYGERGSGIKTSTGKAQDFDKIVKDFKESGKRFEDPEFPRHGAIWGDTYKTKFEPALWREPSVS